MIRIDKHCVDIEEKMLPGDNILTIRFPSLEFAHYLFCETKQLIEKYGTANEEIVIEEGEFYDFLHEKPITVTFVKDKEEEPLLKIRQVWSIILSFIEREFYDDYLLFKSTSDERLFDKLNENANEFLEQLLSNIPRLLVLFYPTKRNIKDMINHLETMY